MSKETKNHEQKPRSWSGAPRLRASRREWQVVAPVGAARWRRDGAPAQSRRALPARAPASPRADQVPRVVRGGVHAARDDYAQRSARSVQDAYLDRRLLDIP